MYQVRSLRTYIHSLGQTPRTKIGARVPLYGRPATDRNRDRPMPEGDVWDS